MNRKDKGDSLMIRIVRLYDGVRNFGEHILHGCKKMTGALAGFCSDLMEKRDDSLMRRGIRESQLTHKQAVAMIPGYMKDELSDTELSSFLHHIENCEECYEEFETSFLIWRTIRYLDEDDDMAFDLKPMMQKDMEEKKHRIRVHRIRTRILASILIVVLVITALIMLDLFGVFRLAEVL